MAPQRILVGVHDGGVTGIDTYAEQVAVAAARVAGAVTLLATGPDLAERLRGRLEGTGVHVEDLGLCPASATEARMIRVWPGVAARRLARGLGPALRRLDRQFDIAHLNHPPLAAVVRPYARRVCVAAWFYPHRHALDRALATWRHTGARFPRSAALVLKSVSHFRNDQRGYRRSDVVVAATEVLAAQLRKQGLPAVHCPPPAHVIAPRELITQPTGAERAFDLVVCAGALGHPRKNVAVALRAVGAVAGSGRRLTVELVGGGAEALREEVRRLPSGVRVSLAGPLPPPAAQARIGGARLLLLPSLFEEWGYVAVEAVLQGTPVVTFPVYPFAEMLPPPLGWQASELSVEAYAATLARALDAPVDRAAVSTLARQRYGVEAIGRRLATIWSSG